MESWILAKNVMMVIQLAEISVVLHANLNVGIQVMIATMETYALLIFALLHSEDANIVMMTTSVPKILVILWMDRASMTLGTNQARNVFATMKIRSYAEPMIQ